MADYPTNAFLRSLPSDVYARLKEQLTSVDLRLGVYLQREGDVTDWVHFPDDSLLSLVSNDPSGVGVETSMIGNEGAAGLLEVCSSGVSVVDSVVQIDGRAWRMPAATCRVLVLTDPAFAAAAWRFMELQMAESRQSGLCQAIHTVEQRCARWLLESQDRCGGRNPLPMTQEFLSTMLGVQRTTVSAFAAQLQRKGAITYARGRIKIVDHSKLEALTCECRRAMVEHRERLGLAAVAVDRSVAPTTGERPTNLPS